MTQSSALQTAIQQDTEATTPQTLAVTVERAVLLKALGHVQSVVERRNTLPILANIKIEAFGNSLSLTATDTDIEITEKIAVEVATEGALTVPAQTLYDIVRKMPDGAQVKLTGLNTAGGKLKITSGSCNFSLSTLPVNDFPVMDSGNMAHKFKLSPLEIISLIDKTKFAISAEETRYYLNGIFFHSRQEESGAAKLCTVATDGHRLAKVEIDAPDGAKSIKGVIIPRKTVGEIRKLVEEGSGDVEISLSDTKISCVCGGAVLISKLIDGTYPEYNRAIPFDNDKDAFVDAAALSHAVDRVATIATDKTRAVKLVFEPGRLTISVSSEENADAREEVEIEYSEQTIELGLNSRYVLEMMSVIKGSRVRIRLMDDNSPALISDSDDESAIFVIMPMKI